jgi:hypothetical protein
MKIFDWAKAAKLIKKYNADHAEAGLMEDWEMTSETIWCDNKPEREAGNFLYSDWATPALQIGDALYRCYKYGEEITGWTKEALAILGAQKKEEVKE